MIFINEAPLKQPLMVGGNIDRVWLRYFAESADANYGYWGNAVISNPYQVEGDDTINILTLQGNTAHLYLKFNGLVSNGEEITIQEPYQVLDDTLKVVQYSAGAIVSIDWILIEDSKFTLPTLDTTNTVIVTGNLRRKQ